MSALPDYEPALSLALRQIRSSAATEDVALAEAAGRILAEPVAADRHLPPFHRAEMDGYALRGRELAAGRVWPVVATIAAGATADIDVPPGCCVAIATGAPLPEGVDTVIEHELSDRGNPVRFTIESIRVGHAVHPRGADADPGDVVVEAGTLLGPHHLGIAAAVGHARLRVRQRPRAAVLTSGDEIVEPGAPVASHQIRNSNRPMIEALLRRFGATPVHAAHVPDERQRAIEAVRGALERCDILITVGGASAGERDHFPAAFESKGVTPNLRGAAIQPGRPVYVGRTGDGQTVVGLPGNPVSVLACACLFVWPIVRARLGLEPALPWRRCALREAVTPNPRRRAFRPAIRDDDETLRVPSWAGSGDLAHTSPTHGLVELPVQSEDVPPGTILRFLPWP